MVAFGAALARKNGIANLEYRLGDLEDVPIRSGTVDVAFLSQALHHAAHPERAIAEAWRILKPGGRAAILDLNRHHMEEAREMYADLWLGFTELDLERFLKQAGFRTSRPPSSIARPKPPISKASSPPVKNPNRWGIL
jgi:ArsR family transcriptional regulator